MAGTLRHRLMNYKYYYTHGLFDLMRRREKHLLQVEKPEVLVPVQPERVIRQDSLLLISAAYPASEENEPSLVSLGGDHAISPMAVDALLALLAACEASCGEKILFTSTYRTIAFQKSIYGVNAFAAKPGESEHHSGLAADIKVDGYAGRRFILSRTGRWMAENAHRFGFIIRYPLWGEKRTGVDYEPWHLRFVGTPHAEIIYRSKCTLEEYLEHFTTGDFYRFGDVYISHQTKEPFVMPDHVEEIFASADVRGGFLVWGKAISNF